MCLCYNHYVKLCPDWRFNTKNYYDTLFYFLFFILINLTRRAQGFDCTYCPLAWMWKCRVNNNRIEWRYSVGVRETYQVKENSRPPTFCHINELYRDRMGIWSVYSLSDVAGVQFYWEVLVWAITLACLPMFLKTRHHNNISLFVRPLSVLMFYWLISSTIKYPHYLGTLANCFSHLCFLVASLTWNLDSASHVECDFDYSKFSSFPSTYRKYLLNSPLIQFSGKDV